MWATIAYLPYLNVGFAGNALQRDSLEDSYYNRLDEELKRRIKAFHKMGTHNNNKGSVATRRLKAFN